MTPGKSQLPLTLSLTPDTLNPSPRNGIGSSRTALGDYITSEGSGVELAPL